MPTVIIAVKAFQRRLEAMHVPRLLVTPHTMGRPLGYPQDRERHQAVLAAALDLLTTATSAGTIREFS
ncbi:hypothetical protein GC175_30440 [bacterium]|nr:hypothetical protein [bacterium]